MNQIMDSLKFSTFIMFLLNIFISSPWLYRFLILNDCHDVLE